MRISELSRAAGVPVPTIKFYLREGLLRPGEPLARNQAHYSDDHVRRLRFIRTLVEVGELKLRAVRRVLDALEDDSISVHELLGVAHHALGPEPEPGEPPEDLAKARAEVDRFIEELGWSVSQRAPARHALARSLATLSRMGRPADASIFLPYARAAERLAARELSRIAEATTREESVAGAIAGTVVFESALVALRRLAQEHHSALRLGAR